MALDFGAGCAGGAAGVLVGFPLDTVKVRIQTQDPSKGLKYTGTFQCLKSIISQEGARAMYRGITSPLAGVAAINAICFGVYGNVNRRLSNPESLRSVTIAGMASGFVQAFVCSPIELVKTQMQVRPDCNKVSETVRSIMDKAGLKGMCRGLGITVCREVPAFGLYFSSYELMVNAKKDSTLWVFTAGGISGIISWVFTYPIDVVKSRLQADSFGQATKYSTAMHCLKQSVAADGFNVLFRGMGSTVIRAFPVNAATMGVVTFIMKSFTKEEMSVYDTMKRMRRAEILHVNLPPTVEKYLKNMDLKSTNKFYYMNNISTIATDGPSIILIRPPELAFSRNKIYSEHIFWSMPSDYQPPENAVTVGTMRSDVTLSTIVRVLERILTKNRNEHDCQEDLLWNSEKAFTNKTCDFMIDSCSGKPLTVIASAHKEEVTDDPILEPSLLRNCPTRNEKLTTADFLQPTSLVTSNHENKIYGFYYLV